MSEVSLSTVDKAAVDGLEDVAEEKVKDSLEVEKELTPAELVVAEIKQAIADKRAKNKEEREKPLEDGINEIFKRGDELKERLIIANGKRNGVCEFYNKGIMTLKATYIDDVMDGPAVSYGPKGDMSAKMFYKNNKRHGVVETYKKGRIASMAMFENDQPNGLKIKYDAQGNVKTKAPKVKGKTHGVAETFDKLGVLAKTCEFMNGVKHGFQKGFYPDGSLQKIEEYRQGLREGVERIFYPDGALKAETEYKTGKIVRAKVAYTPDGKVIEK